MAPGLLDMPEDVMSKIMKAIGIEAILTLRKVCHNFRNLIDDVKPYAKLESIAIDLECKDAIFVDYTCCKERHYLRYKKDEEGCLVENLGKEKKVLLKNKHFITVCMKDIEIVLRHQESTLQRFCVYVGKETSRNENLAFMEHFERILKSRAHPLKVEFFNSQLKDQNQLMAILPFLDSKTLKRVRISSWDGTMEVDQLVKLDHWKNVQLMDLDCWVDLEYIQHFTHFSADYLHFRATHFPDLVSLKDIYLQSTGFKNIWIKITEPYDLDDVRRTTELLGEAFFDVEEEEDADNVKTRWFYRIPATDKVLEICVKNSDVPVVLSRIDEDDVPQEAVIQN